MYFSPAHWSNVSQKTAKHENLELELIRIRIRTIVMSILIIVIG